MPELETVNPYQASEISSIDDESTSIRVIIATGCFIVAAIIILGSIWLGWWRWIIADPLSLTFMELALLSATGSIALAFMGVGIGVLRRYQRVTLVCLMPIGAAILFLMGQMLR